MKDVKSVEIIINSLNRNIVLSIDPNNLIVNNSKKVDKRIIEELFNTICFWNNEYVSNNIIDAEEFTVKIITNSGTDVFHGKGKYPNNYEEFLRIVGELNE